MAFLHTLAAIADSVKEVCYGVSQGQFIIEGHEGSRRDFS